MNEGSEADESQHSKGPLTPRILFSSCVLLLETLVIKRRCTRKIDDVITDLEYGRAGGMLPRQVRRGTVKALCLSLSYIPSFSSSEKGFGELRLQGYHRNHPSRALGERMGLKTRLG